MKKLSALLFIALCVPMLSGCSTSDNKIHVNFEPVTTLKTNTIKEQVFETASKVKKPTVVIIGDNPDSLQLYGWYTSKEFTTEWNFSKDIATASMTLYGRFESQYTVNYYQGIDEKNLALLATETVFKNEIIPTREDLPDCYENPETCYLTNVETSEEGVISGTKGSAVNFATDKVDGNKNVFMRRSTNFYFSPEAINRRFSPVASCAGNNGSTVGSITVLSDEISGESYAHVDFGEASEKDPVIDPYILIDNPQIDVTSSQFIEITMRNPGYGDTLSFYWVGKWKVNGQWINGKEYHSFAEDRAFKFKAGSGTSTESTVYEDASPYKLKYWNNSNEWRTYLLPISNKTSNGVSVWGCAGVITALRIQSSFPASNPSNKRTNVIDIKSIRGVKSDKVYDFDDSQTIESLKVNATEAELNTASAKQADVTGVIFPKNRGYVKPTDENTTIYNHVNGLAMYGKYVNGKASIEIDLPTEKEVDLDTNTTFNFKYCNRSYVDKITFVFRVRLTSGAAIGRELNVTQNFSCSTQMSEMQDAKINMFGVDSYEGHLIKLTAYFTTIGVDNYVEFGEFRFSEYEPKPIVGVNFYDMNCGGFVGETGLDVSYSKEKHATKFAVTNQNSKATCSSLSYDLVSFKSLTLTYNVESGTSITQVIFKMKKKGKTDLVTYTFNVNSAVGDHEETLDISDHNAIDTIYVSFVGSGNIYLKTLKYNFYDDTLDFTTGEYLSFKNTPTDVSKKYIYDKNELALTTNMNSAEIHARLGVRVTTDGLRINGKYIYNIPLAGKSSIVVTYQNRSAVTSFNMGFGALRKTDFLQDDKYLTQEALPSAKVTINGESKSGGAITIRNLEANMTSGQWATYTFPIDSFFTRSTLTNVANGEVENIECYLATFYFATNASMGGGSFFIRNFSVI